MQRPPIGLVGLSILIAACVMLPVVYLLIRAAGVGSEAWSILARPSIWRVFVNSAVLAAIVSVASIAIGVPLALITARTDVPLRAFWSVVLVLPLALPSYIAAYAFIGLLAGRWPALYGLPGTALVISLINYPFVLLTVRASIARMDPSLEEAARGLGCRKREVFWKVTLPHLRPSMASGGLLVALYALSDFGTPSLMQFSTFTRAIYTQYSASFNRNTAALLALALVVLTLVLLTAEMFTRGRARYYKTSSSTQRKIRIVRLGRLRWPAFALCALVFFVSLVCPVGALLYWLAEGMSHGQSLNLTWMPIFNSVLAATLAAFAATAAALPVVFLAVRYKGLWVRSFDRLTYIGNALPGIVIGLALVFFGARHVPWLYQTLPMLVFGYTIRFLPQSVGSLRSSMLQIPPRLEEASLSLGHKRLATFGRVTLPLLTPGLLAGAALVFLTTIKELPLTLLLRPTGYETLVSEVWYAASEGLFSQASPPALLLVAVSGFSVMILLFQERRGYES